MNIFRCILPALLVLVRFANAQVKEPVDFVNTYIGGISHLLVPTYPTMQLPQGMLRFVPARNDMTDDQLRGFNLLLTSHRSQAVFNVRPFADGFSVNPQQRYLHDNEILRPYSYQVSLPEQHSSVNAAPGAQAALFRFGFAQTGRNQLLLQAGKNGQLSVQQNQVSGTLRFGENGATAYLFLETDVMPLQAVGDSGKLLLTFSAAAIHCRYGVSFISLEQARKNLRREITSYDLSALQSRGRQLWNKALGRIQVDGGSDNDRTIFYTALYRCLERPVVISEDGKYFSPFDGQVHPDEGIPFVIDDWIWDTYRAKHPLLLLLDSSLQSSLVHTYLRAAEQSPQHWMPTFPTITGDAHGMNGQHFIPFIWDTWRKGIHSFDLRKAYDHCRHTAQTETIAPWTLGSRNILDSFYDTHGYYPALYPGEKENLVPQIGWEKRQTVPVTLAASYDDWCLAQMALALGEKADYDKYMQRSKNYQHLFNPRTAFFHPKDMAGKFIEPFDYKFSGGQGARDYYDENNGYTFRWDVPHAIPDLIRMMGGNELFVKRLDSLFVEPLGKSKYEFWQVLPDQSGNVGQFSMGNEPSLHIPYLYNYAGAPWKTQRRVRSLLQQWFRNDWMGIPGDEDGGGISAFVVFSMLGFYPVTVGLPEYALCSPVFPKATIPLTNGKKWIIEAPGTSVANKYIQAYTVNGRPQSSYVLPHETLTKGGVIRFDLRAVPVTKQAVLPLDTSNSLDAVVARQQVLDSQPLSLDFQVAGQGRFASSGNQWHLAVPTTTGVRATGSAGDPDYATYGDVSITARPSLTNWQNRNRLSVDIFADAAGQQAVNINLRIDVAGGNGMDHLIHLQPGWNHCLVDLQDLDRGEVVALAFHVTIKGRGAAMADSVYYTLRNLRLEKVAKPEITKGWAPQRLVYSGSGYLQAGRKVAIAAAGAAAPGTFRLLTADQWKVVVTGTATRKQTTTGVFDVIDFSSFTDTGRFCIEYRGERTPAFSIGHQVFTGSVWKALNFLFCQRCGYDVPGIHSACHADLFSRHEGQKIAFNGGWHDAGDLSQQTLQTADVSFALLEAYEKNRKVNPSLAARLLEEAEWGLDFVVRNRYGDGYRASSMGLLIWTDGVIGTFDDIASVRVQNIAFDNFLYSGYEAYAARILRADTARAAMLTRIAKADFEFALAKEAKSGFGGFIHFYEHSFNTSRSQYEATISWSASQLYQLTRDPRYAKIAADRIRYTLRCQRLEPLGDAAGTKGFFYRDTTRQSIVHYIHQSREQVYMQSLVTLCETQPQHPDYRLWTAAIKTYGQYLKQLMAYTAPFGMVPSGVYNKYEYRDSAAFYALHLFPPANARELYSEQFNRGVAVDSLHAVKRFPVWFSIFNGNLAIQLATGKAAAVAGRFLKDEALLQIGREQLYWTVGLNPFGQSLMYGEGTRYPSMDSFSSGEITGEMPVGIKSYHNQDVPYWPSVNNATYKEVWVTSAGKWLSLLAAY